VELAEIMRSNGFVIAARTLNKYINETRARPANRRKKQMPPAAAKSKATTAKSGSSTADAPRTMATPPSLLPTKPPARKLEKLRRTFSGIASMTMRNEQDLASRQLTTPNPDSNRHLDMATATAAAVKPHPRAAALPVAVKRVTFVANEERGVGTSVFTRRLVDHLRISGKRVAADHSDWAASKSSFPRYLLAG
jgi:hypothetical protein